MSWVFFTTAPFMAAAEREAGAQERPQHVLRRRCWLLSPGCYVNIQPSHSAPASFLFYDHVSSVSIRTTEELLLHAALPPASGSSTCTCTLGETQGHRDTRPRR
ncbi:hypothetical protein EYF80_036893 [Liparis tanakae]|uniref:Uncharacterized protein n=1 Tax=Liparis tanakae TaxID=230148 RepID=A0A4Z2GHT1_9TELE|nr:hypothetical protein EYF80_036893 [Liparis tanakae]